MHVLIKPELEQFVAEKMRTGAYSDVNALVNQALEVLRDQEELFPGIEGHLREELTHGVEQLDAGQTSSFTAEQVIAEERARLQRGAR